LTAAEAEKAFKEPVKATEQKKKDTAAAELLLTRCDNPDDHPFDKRLDTMTRRNLDHFTTLLNIPVEAPMKDKKRERLTNPMIYRFITAHLCQHPELEHKPQWWCSTLIFLAMFRRTLRLTLSQLASTGPARRRQNLHWPVMLIVTDAYAAPQADDLYRPLCRGERGWDVSNQA
jgi:hypothetical protein